MEEALREARKLFQIWGAGQYSVQDKSIYFNGQKVLWYSRSRMTTKVYTALTKNLSKWEKEEND